MFAMMPSDAASDANAGSNDVSAIEDFQLEWSVHVIESGQAGDDHPTMGTPPTRSN